MTFIAFEQSQRDGKPVELFLFQRPGTATGEGFTNALNDITIAAQFYTANSISRDEVSYARESNAGEMKITVPTTLNFVRRYIIIAPADRYTVSVFRRHVTDAGTLETVTWWKGFISQVVFEGSTAIISCKPLIELLSRQGPRMTFQQPCNHVLYDSRCTVVENSFRFQGVPSVISADGLDYTFAGLSTSPPQNVAPSGFQSEFYVGGFIRAQDLVDHRLIVAQSGNVLTVQFAFLDSQAGTILDVFAGCDHQLTTCALKFSNDINHGGHPYLPDRNIFEKGLDSTGRPPIVGHSVFHNLIKELRAAAELDD